jgi:CHAD domain-containing protein
MGRQQSDTFKKRLDPFVRALSRLEARDAEALHQARVGSRRLRELVPVLELQGDTARKVVQRLRRVTRRLGRLRELDVLQPIIDDLRQTGLHSDEALDRVAAAIAEEASRTRQWLERKLPARKRDRLARTLDDIGRHIDGSRAARHTHARDASAWVWAVDARIVRRAKRLATALVDAGALYDATRLHNVRIALKKLRYAVELSADARRVNRAAEIATLKRAQDTLGRLHDFEVFGDRVQRVREQAAAASSGIDVRTFDSLVDAVERECHHMHAAFMSERSELVAIADRLGSETMRRIARGQRPRIAVSRSR